jgi:hypothetical protein
MGAADAVEGGVAAFSLHPPITHPEAGIEEYLDGDERDSDKGLDRGLERGLDDVEYLDGDECEGVGVGGEGQVRRHGLHLRREDGGTRTDDAGTVRVGQMHARRTDAN